MPVDEAWGKIIVLLFAVPTAAFLLYMLHRQNDEGEEEDLTSKPVETSPHSVINVMVPVKAVGTVIGRRGTTIKEIQEVTAAKIRFTDQDSKLDKTGDRSLEIHGTKEAAQKAEIMIRKIIADKSAVFTEEIEVPGYCLGRIIGRGGENIRQMSRSSECNIYIDKSQDARGSHVPKVISLSGSEQQIQLAKTLIKEKITEEEEFRIKIAVAAGNREHRTSTKWHSDENVTSSLSSREVGTEESWGHKTRKMLMSSSQVKEFMNVFVSAIEHPGHFWVQIVTETALHLDTMIDDMTAFYSNPDTIQIFRISEVNVGDLVAAPYQMDKMWYRARVLGFTEGKVDLYFIDFGDNGLAEVNQLRELRPEYLNLPVQAVECKLAGVKSSGEHWSDEACEIFEKLTCCAQWKILSAHTVGYESHVSGQMPCLQLFQESQEQQVDIAAELVAKGYAVWDPVQIDSDTKLVRRLLNA